MREIVLQPMTTALSIVGLLALGMPIVADVSTYDFQRSLSLAFVVLFAIHAAIAFRSRRRDAVIGMRPPR